jgi:hypothetical protein
MSTGTPLYVQQPVMSRGGSAAGRLMPGAGLLPGEGFAEGEPASACGGRWVDSERAGIGGCGEGARGVDAARSCSMVMIARVAASI